MSFGGDSRVIKVRISKDMSLGATMSNIRTWLDGQKIQPVRCETLVDAEGFTLTIAFQRDDEGELFRQRFDETQP